MRRSVIWTMVLAAVLSAAFFPRLAVAETPTLFRHLGNDVKDIFTEWPAVFLLGGAVISGGLSPEDDAIQSHFSHGRHLGKADTIGNYAGEFYTVDGASLLVYGVGKLAHDEKVALTGEALLEALFFTELAAGGLKVAVHRHRPDGGKYSFPSGHAARTFAAASVLELLDGPAFGVPAFLIASFISFTRLDSNVHHLSDLIAGAALGSAFGFGTALFHKQEYQRVHLAPMAGGGVYGISANVVF